MKTGVLLTICLLVSFLSQASEQCPLEVAQFAGTVIDQQMAADGSGACSYRISFSKFTSSSVCLMDDQFARVTRLKSDKCRISEGQEVSGYLIYKDGELSIEGFE